jgi:hypothetical protein
MPTNKSLMASLIKQYGGKKGQDVYYGMETEAAQGKGHAKVFSAEALRKRKSKLKKKVGSGSEG